MPAISTLQLERKFGSSLADVDLQTSASDPQHPKQAGGTMHASVAIT